MWFNLLGLAAKTGMHVYQNRQNQKRYMSDAALLHAERMAKGEIEYKGQVLTSHEKGWKDELVLLIICLPIALIAWSVFSGDPAAQEKLDLFFFYFNKEIPLLIVGFQVFWSSNIALAKRRML